MGPSPSTEDLTPGDLNRTLLLRQGLLARTAGDPIAMVHHLVGLQAQDRLPPYVGLAARLQDVDPLAVSTALQERRLVRMVCLRGTVHLLTPADALCLRAFTAPVQEREWRASQTIAPARHLPVEEVRRAAEAVLADGPLAFKTLGERLAGHFPDVPANALAHVARVACPLAQLPPRGRWKLPGGVVLQPVDAWLGQPLAEPDVPGLVRRYLRAFGPATAADVSAWSGVPGLAAVLKEMADLEVRRSGRTVLYDVPGAPLASSDQPAPVRLLGTYDNVWLAHAKRDRVTTPEDRRRWMGSNGGMASTVFVDGRLAGLWRAEGDRPVVVELFRDLTRAQQAELDEELERMTALLAVPADR